MSILIDKSTRLIVQGITGRDGLFHAKKMKEYGTHVVGGTSPGKGGTDVDGIPVFNTMYDAVEQTKANTSIIFVPARFAADAIMEAADAGIRLIVCIAEGIPTLDVIKAHQFVEQKGAMLIGPNCPGLISPGKSMVGILPGQVFLEGNVGVISRSGTLTYEIVYNPQIQISAESGTKRSIFRQKNKTKRSKKRLHTTLIKPEQKVNEDLCSCFIVS